MCVRTTGSPHYMYLYSLYAKFLRTCCEVSSQELRRFFAPPNAFSPSLWSFFYQKYDHILGQISFYCRVCIRYLCSYQLYIFIFFQHIQYGRFIISEQRHNRRINVSAIGFNYARPNHSRWFRVHTLLKANLFKVIR